MSSRDLTGRWDGIFNYPRTLPPTGFLAILVEADGVVSGEIEEVSRDAGLSGVVLASVVEGERIGSIVRFTKHYDDLARAHYVIRYDGTLSAEGDEITGEWTIPGVWSGTFIMIRAAGLAASEEREAVADATVPVDTDERPC